jgi:assimilatory nitrate reductase catalytic subunit
VRVQAYRPSWFGFILSRRRLNVSSAAYWSLSRGEGMWRYEIAGNDTPGDWAGFSRSILCRDADKVEWVEYFDSHATRYRAARMEDGRLESCIFIGPSQDLPERDWLARLFAAERLDDTERMSLLSGKAPGQQHDSGRVVCACFHVGVNTIREAIREQHLCSVEAVGEVLKAGTNCGSCQPEIKKLIEQAGAVA